MSILIVFKDAPPEDTIPHHLAPNNNEEFFLLRIFSFLVGSLRLQIP